VSALASRLGALAAAARQRAPRLPGLPGPVRLVARGGTAADPGDGELHDPDVHEEDVLDWLGFRSPEV
jgi:hypothetical protein